MFDKICINRQELFGMGIDFGFLAEALVFYQRVNLVADNDMFKALLRVCGYEVVLELMEMGALSIEYIENRPIVSQHTRETPYLLYDFGFAATEVWNFQHVAPELLKELTGKSGKGRRMAARFERQVRRISSDKSVADEAREDVSDDAYVESMARALLSHFAPEYRLPDPCIFRLRSDHLEHRLETNIDFDQANALFIRPDGAPDATLTPGYLLSLLLTTRRDLNRAAEFSTDLAVSAPTSLVAKCKFDTLLTARAGNDTEIKSFEDFIFDESRTIREAVNGGNRNFDDVLRLVKGGLKFKDWLAKSGPDTNIVKEYCREVTRAEWADKLPPKTARWAIFAAAGTIASFALSPIAGTAVGLGLGAGDTFLLDKVIKGWKPNQFVNGPLRDFVKR